MSTLHSSITRRRAAFTLIELLIVIAVIAILIGLLLPAVVNMRYQSRSMTCLSDKRQIVTGLTAYAMDHDGSYPYRPGGSGMIMNPQDHNCFILQQARAYGVPYGTWVCAASGASLDERNAQVEAGVKAGVQSGTWKWITAASVTYWVEQGGSSAGACYKASASNSVSSRFVSRMKPDTVIVADFMTCTVPGEPAGSPHTRGSKIAHSFVAFADGRVEQRNRSDVRRRFASGYTHAY